MHSGASVCLLGVVGMLEVTKRFEYGSRMSAPAEHDAGSLAEVTAAANKAPTAEHAVAAAAAADIADDVDAANLCDAAAANMRLVHCVPLQLIGRKAGGKDVEEIAALGTTMGKLGDVLLNAAAGLLSGHNAQQVGRSFFLLGLSRCSVCVGGCIGPARPQLAPFATGFVGECVTAGSRRQPSQLT